MDNIKLVGIDISKHSFHIFGVNHKGKALMDRRVSRHKLLENLVSIPRTAPIAMEACGGAHYWGRTFQDIGYQVKLLAPQFVKPYVKSHKNDRADAQAIAEAASRDSMRLVSVKSLEQQDLQSLHRVRQRTIKGLTAAINELRGLLSEYGIVIPLGRSALKSAIFKIIEGNLLTERMKALTHSLYKEILFLEEQVRSYTRELEYIAKSTPQCRALETIPGVGSISSTAIYAAIGSPTQFKNGRAFAAWLGLVPKQHSSGGKTKLGRISKRGNVYLRTLLIQGARAFVKVSARHNNRYGLWVQSLRKKRGYNKASVALANRNARIAWAIMKNGDTFKESSLFHEIVH